MPKILCRSLLLGVAAIALSAAQAAAGSGVVAAVTRDPSAASTGGAGSNCALPAGTEIEVGQTITACRGELIDLLLVDGTSITVAPESSISIDQHIVDPTNGRTFLVVTILRGVIRLISDIHGVISKIEKIERIAKIRRIKNIHDIIVRTPAGPFGVQDDTIARFAVTPDATFALVDQGEVREIPFGADPSPGGRRQVIVTKFSSRIEEALQEKINQALSPKLAALTQVIVKHNAASGSALGSERFEIKEFRIGASDGSPVVTSYNRLTGEANAATEQGLGARRSGIVAERQPSVVQKISAAIANRPYQANVQPRQ